MAAAAAAAGRSFEFGWPGKVISQCMNILTLTRDKDMFFEYYKKHFAMRLLGDRNQARPFWTHCTGEQVV